MSVILFIQLIDLSFNIGCFTHQYNYWFIGEDGGQCDHKNLGHVTIYIGTVVCPLMDLDGWLKSYTSKSTEGRGSWRHLSWWWSGITRGAVRTGQRMKRHFHLHHSYHTVIVFIIIKALQTNTVNLLQEGSFFESFWWGTVQAYKMSNELFVCAA